MALINTHATIKKLIKDGFSEQQAESLVEAINDKSNELATKADISRLESEMSVMNVNIKWLIAIVLVILGILLKNTIW